MAFFDKADYKNSDTKYTSINVPMFLAKPFIKKALREDNESEELIAIIKKVKKIKVLTVENGNKEMLKDFSKYLDKNKYEDWITIKQDGNNVNIQALQNGDVIKKLIILVKSDKDLVFVDVKGNFTPDDLSKLINQAQDKEEKFSKSEK